MEIFHEESGTIQERILQDELVERLLLALKSHHEDSYHHSLRVGLLSIDLGLENGVNRGHLTILGYAAHLHDIGKEAVGIEILEKASALSDEERCAVRNHPRDGFITLSKEGLNDVKQLVVNHHEFQLSSYPRSEEDRRKDARASQRRGGGEHLESLGEILAVADMFDALTSKRSYKDRLPKERVEGIIRSEFTGSLELIGQVLGRFSLE